MHGLKDIKENTKIEDIAATTQLKILLTEKLNKIPESLNSHKKQEIFVKRKCV